MAKVLEENLVNLFSENRLNSYKYDDNDTNSIILERYLYNIELSKALYPLLSIENCYNDLRKLLGYISKDSLLYLDKICDFKEVIKKQKPQ